MASHKLPVFETIGASYRFVFGNLAPIFTVCAVPIGLLSVAGYLLNRWSLDDQIANFNPADHEPKAHVAAAFEPTALALPMAVNCIEAALVGFAAAALHRMVLFGQHHPRLSAGPIDLRFVGLSVAAVIAYGVLAAVYFWAIFGSVQDKTSPAAALPIIIAYLVILIISLRFVQMFPIVVAEGRISFARSWELTRGNWGAIFFTYLLAFLPFFFAGMVSMFLVVGTGVFSSIGQDGAAMLKMLQATRDTLLPMAVLNFVLYVLSTALGVALLSFGYKKLNGQDFYAVVTEQD